MFKQRNKLSVLCAIFFFLVGCEKEIDKYYERPDWLPGSSWTVLEKKGGYSLFLEGIKRSGLQTIVAGRGLCTVFAPTDEAVLTYLKSKGYSSIEDMPEDELKQWIGYHIVEYSYKRDALVAFNPEGLENSEEGTGEYYKHKTFSRVGIQSIADPITGATKPVLRQERYLPVISGKLFETLELSDPAYNYNYFYPKTQYQAGINNVQVGNSSVVEYAIPSDNGYIYTIDQALSPLRSVYQVLEDETLDFSLFKELYDRFAKFSYHEELSKKYSMDSLFLYHHESVPMIASEWTFNYEGGFHTNVGKASGEAYNSFVPTTNSLYEFLMNFFESYSGSEDVNNIDLLSLDYFLKNHVLARRIIFPEQIKNGKCTSPNGDEIRFDVDNAVHKEICGNGTFYGINEVVKPAMFKSVTAPVFKSDKYSIFRYILHQAGQTIQLINPDVDHTLFVPDDTAFIKAGIRLNVGDINKLGDEKIERLKDDESGDYELIPAAEVAELAAYHIVLEDITSMQEKKIYKTKADRAYIKCFDGGVLGEVEGESSNPVVLLGNKGQGITNGTVYMVDQIIDRPSEEDATIMLLLSSHANYSSFYAKLKEAGLVEEINGVETIGFLVGETVMTFLPTNEMVEKMTFPTDSKELKEYLKSFFISLEGNGVIDYVLPGLEGAGKYKTLGLDLENSNEIEDFYATWDISMGTDFNLIINSPLTKEVYHTAADQYPVFATDGLIYEIKPANN